MTDTTTRIARAWAALHDAQARPQSHRAQAEDLARQTLDDLEEVPLRERGPAWVQVIVAALNTVASFQRDDLDAAETLYTTAMHLVETAHVSRPGAPMAVLLCAPLLLLAMRLRRARPREALVHIERAVALAEEAHGDEPNAITADNLGQCLAEQAELVSSEAQAVALLRRAIALRSEALKARPSDDLRRAVA